MLGKMKWIFTSIRLTVFYISDLWICVFLFEFQLLGEWHCWWTSESPRAHVAKFCGGRLRLIRSVWRASNFPCLKLIAIVILWVYYTIPFGFSLLRQFLVIAVQLFILHVWLRITDEGSVPEMRI